MLVIVQAALFILEDIGLYPKAAYFTEAALIDAVDLDEEVYSKIGVFAVGEWQSV